MKEDCHHHFRFKSKEVYTKLIKKFGSVGFVFPLLICILKDCFILIFEEKISEKYIRGK